jgi:hypothetical protein
MCGSCLTIQPVAHLIILSIPGFEPVLACASPVVCRQRAQLRGVWCVIPAAVPA